VRIRTPAHGDLYQTLIQERDIFQQRGEKAHG
jgi:hypothetical protein